ncbi:MAG: hypothetical protein BGO41_15295 [Clostridiales bacterium 38-18]|nr:MAG: hypothetical protein BGO41_15295 [Clostridiales bacterium 38-18]
MYTIIIEQTKAYKKRVKYIPESHTFSETEYDSLMYMRNFPFPYGWIKETGTPPQKHLDVILISDEDYELGDEKGIKLIGVFIREDGDHKLISVLNENKKVKDLSDLTKSELNQLYSLYPKVLENEGWYGKEKADKVVENYLLSTNKIENLY